MLGHTKIKMGLPASQEDAMAQDVVHDRRDAGSAAFLSADYRGLRPSLTVSPGDKVRVGDIVFTDRKHPEVGFAAPLAGRVASIDYGARRTLSALVIEADSGEQADDSSDSEEFGDPDNGGVRRTLLKRGLWPAFLTRPFGRIPKPDAVPAAIFVNATQASLQAPAPSVVLEHQKAEFQKGVELLTYLTDGPVYVCQAPQDTLCAFSERVECAFFSGTPASGLSGTHIDQLYPVRLERQVWSILYQDVAAIGHLFLTGHYQPNRVFSISGPCSAEPKLVRTCLGAGIGQICNGEVTIRNGRHRARLLSGDAVTGWESAFIGRHHQQITILDAPPEKGFWHWMSRPSASHGALIPTAALERALAVDVLPVPLMRALSVGDSAAAERLGCLALVEEDVAALTRLCTSGADYGVLLRDVLDDLAGEAV